jgi:hypothetical protein
MEPQELELIQSLSPKHDELRHLWNKHLDYEKDLGRLTGLRYPSEAERREIGKIKRLKLRGKERIQAILDTHRVR